MLILFLICITIAVSSCREEIIPPGNPAGNINEPVLESHIDYYTFKINASNVTFNFNDYTYFNASKNYLSFSLIDHKSGSAAVLIMSKTHEVLYEIQLDKDFSRTTVILDGSIPEYLSIKLNNFTGKMNLQLSRF